MNILYVTEATNPQGIANAQALSYAGAKVSLRFLDGSLPSERTLTPRLSFYDAVVQHVPAKYFAYFGQAGVNIGYLDFPTIRPDVETLQKAQLLDMVIVPTVEQLTRFHQAISWKPFPISICPSAVDMSKYQKSYKDNKRFSEYKEDGKFLFYTICRFDKQHNMSGLLQAYVSEFGRSEPVGLVIKASAPHISIEDVAQRIYDVCMTTVKGCGLGEIAIVYLLPDNLTSDELMSLHQTCDCFVMPHYGFSSNQSVFDALAMGNTPIVTNTNTYINQENGWMLSSRVEPCFADENFTSHQLWDSPSIWDLKQCMRQVYDNKHQRAEKSALGMKVAYDYSIEAIGPRLYKVINDYVQSRRSA